MLSALEMALMQYLECYISAIIIIIIIIIIEIDKVGHCLVLDWDQGLVQIEIGLDVSNVESMTTLPMNVLIWFLIIQIGKVTVQGQYHCI